MGSAADSVIATSHWTHWPIERLLDLKVDQRISLVVPARNEAGTVGEVIARLQATRALVDEIVVIDSDSTDETFAVATEAGAQVFRAHEIRPDLPAAHGKGEAMWKSQFVTTGDLIVFMDADLTEWDTHFVPGLVGPLLDRPQLQLVKGFYRRSGPEGGFEGGRVTELVARPLLALAAPELAALVQPLAGEWSIRRSAFERLSVPSGYGVEMAAVLDVSAAHGVSSLAQVDLGDRGHRHQSIHDLAAMSVQVMAAALARMPDCGQPGPAGVTLRQFCSDETGRVETSRAVDIHERPPGRPSPARDL